MKTSDAIKKAQELDMDLVLITESSTPPVAKILEFNKFQYDERKKASASKSKSKKSELKEFRFGPTIGEGDLVKKIERAREFIMDKNRVKVSVILKGREGQYPEFGYDKINRFTKELEDIAKLENAPKRLGSNIFVYFVSKG